MSTGDSMGRPIMLSCGGTTATATVLAPTASRAAAPPVRLLSVSVPDAGARRRAVAC